MAIDFVRLLTLLWLYYYANFSLFWKIYMLDLLTIPFDKSMIFHHAIVAFTCIQLDTMSLYTYHEFMHRLIALEIPMVLRMFRYPFGYEYKNTFYKLELCLRLFVRTPIFINAYFEVFNYDARFIFIPIMMIILDIYWFILIAKKIKT